MSCHGESTVKHINQWSFQLNSCRISGYFDTKFNVVALIEPILHKFEDLKIANFFLKGLICKNLQNAAEGGIL